MVAARQCACRRVQSTVRTGLHPSRAVTGDDPVTGASNAWRDFFALRDQTAVPADFMNDRPLNEPLKPREFFEDR
jgi:hypothetical protein